MRKVIAAFNTTIDGNCDHTAGIADQELHKHYTSLLENAGKILYGRITFELMQYWQTMLLHPSDEQELNEFAKSIDKIPKIVFSQTLKKTNWETAEIATKPLVEVINELMKEEGKDILIGSRSLIIQLMNLNLIDELQLCIHPVIAGPGISLFEDIENRTVFQLKKTKNFNNGAIILYYSPIK
ncbi:dihydrofolate reductase family protein [Sphingobacterium hotanense]|uniref:Dihydrofolate reductase family protein n=2 Tax=Sphingobacterium TaxID=28453 RepID=A0ABT7NKT0_9SPHI|nr:dihydrofolate reductase family protein [Sphingobacterium hotanense]MDM1047808.1 dihydrofolate reductase family protein [Sphingobacterium hotanense]